MKNTSSPLDIIYKANEEKKVKEEAWIWVAIQTVGYLNFLRLDNAAFDTIYTQAQKQLECVLQDRKKKGFPDVHW